MEKQQSSSIWDRYVNENSIPPVKTLKFKVREGVCVCVTPCLFEFFQRLLRPEDKLQRDVFAVTVRSTAGAQNMLCHFVQCGRADDPRVTQG